MQRPAFLFAYLLVSMTSRRACPKRPNPTPWFKGRGHDWNASKKHLQSPINECVKLTPCNHVASCQFMRLSVAHLFPLSFTISRSVPSLNATRWLLSLQLPTRVGTCDLHTLCLRSEKGAFCTTWPLRIAFASNTIFALVAEPPERVLRSSELWRPDRRLPRSPDSIPLGPAGPDRTLLIQIAKAMSLLEGHGIVGSRHNAGGSVAGWLYLAKLKQQRASGRSIHRVRKVKERL